MKLQKKISKTNVSIKSFRKWINKGKQHTDKNAAEYH